MNPRTLFQLGGLALVVSALMFGLTDILYFLSGEQPQTTFGLWVGIVGSGFRVLGVFALFARQSQRGGIPGLIGMILLVWGSMTAVGFQAVLLGVSAGAFSNQQLAQVQSYAFASTLLTGFLVLGEIVLGASIYLAQVFPKYAGALLVLVGVLHFLTGPLAFTRPIYAICSVAAYIWLGWILLRDTRELARETVPAP